MQNALTYVRTPSLLTAGNYKFIGTGPITRVGRISQFSQKVLWSGSFASLHATIPVGTKHPVTAYPYFFADDYTGAPVPMPFGNLTLWQGTINFRGIIDPAKCPIEEEYGTYIQGRLFAPTSGGASTFTSPTLPSGVVTTQVNQEIPSYSRRWVGITPVPDLFVDGVGIQAKPTNFTPPNVPAAISWLVNAQATHYWPNGWYRVSSTSAFVRLSSGTAIPLYENQEQWLYGPLKSTV